MKRNDLRPWRALVPDPLQWSPVLPRGNRWLPQPTPAYSPPPLPILTQPPVVQLRPPLGEAGQGPNRDQRCPKM
eukprot:gene10002-biopygen1323